MAGEELEKALQGHLLTKAPRPQCNVRKVGSGVGSAWLNMVPCRTCGTLPLTLKHTRNPIDPPLRQAVMQECFL